MAIGTHFDGDGEEYVGSNLRENDKWRQRGQDIDSFGGEFTGIGRSVCLSGRGDIVAFEG